MRFDRRQRVVYSVNPLNEVICQLRFSPLLALSAQLPVDFQQRLRADYPMLSIVQGMTVQFGQASPQPAPPDNTYAFVTSDGKWTAQLTKDSLSLTTSAYERWDQFRGRWQVLLGHFLALYGPISPIRLGLRYQDVIDRDKHGLGTEPWSHWIKPQILGVLADPACEDAEQHQAVTVLPLEQVGHLLLRTGLVPNAQTQQLAFLIDSDFYADLSTGHTLEPDLASILTRLDRFNAEAGGLFRWCITEQLHAALDPKLV